MNIRGLISPLRNALILFLVLVCVNVNAGSVGSESYDDSFIHIMALGCEVKIPSAYVLNTKNDHGFVFVRFGGGDGAISFYRYDQSVESIGDKVLKEFEYGRLRVRIFDRSNASSWQEGLTFVVVDDGKQVMSIVGDDVTHWRAFLEDCITPVGNG